MYFRAFLSRWNSVPVVRENGEQRPPPSVRTGVGTWPAANLLNAMSYSEPLGVPSMRRHENPRRAAHLLTLAGFITNPSASNHFRGLKMLQRSLRSPLAIGALFLSALFCAAAPRPAAAQDQGAAAFIQNLGTQGLQSLAAPEPQRVARFRQLFDTGFDIPEISRFVLGPYARSMPPQEQQEFQSLFRDYIARSYSTRLAPYAGSPFRVTGERPYGGEAIVTSQVTRPGGQPTEIDWHVMNNGGRYLITDVVVGGVSMKVTQRDEFAAIIQRNGGRPEALLAALRQQLGQGSYYGSSIPRR
jgi:phospholipid transport system substrate-binding protein